MRSAFGPTLSVFSTALGWLGVVGGGSAAARGDASEDTPQVSYLTLGHPTADEVQRNVQRMLAESGQSTQAVDVADWHPELRTRIERYCAGERVAFDDVPLALRPHTEFQSRILESTRAIPYGQRISYAELAQQAGYPRAARAVGTVMSSNRLPLLIPCHRVVGSGGKLGGYSAPQGLTLKAWLLQLESGAE